MLMQYKMENKPIINALTFPEPKPLSFSDKAI